MKRNNKILIVLILNFLMLIFFNFAHPVTPAMMIDKSTPDEMYGILFMMMSLGSFFGSQIWGKKMDVNGTKRYMVLGPLFYVFGQIIFGLSYSNFLMMVGRLISGLAASAWLVGVNTSVNILSNEDNKANNFGYVMATMSLGGVVGLLLSGYIGRIHWQYSFIFQILMLIILVIISSIILENQYIEQKKENEKYSIKKTIKLIKDENMVYSLLGIICFIWVINILKSAPSFFISQQIRQYGETFSVGSNEYLKITELSTLSVGFINASVSFFMLISTLFVIRYVRKLTFSKQINLQFVITLIGYIVFMFLILTSYYGIIIYNIETLVILIIITLLFMVGPMAINRPLVQKELLTNTTENQGLIIGIINSAGAVGMVLASLGHSISMTISNILIFFIVGFALIIGYLFFQVSIKRLKVKDD